MHGGEGDAKHKQPRPKGRGFNPKEFRSTSLFLRCVLWRGTYRDTKTVRAISMNDKPETAAGISLPRLAGSASDVRRMALHEAICRCPKCKGTIDKAKLCPTCAETDAAIDAMKPNAAGEGREAYPAPTGSQSGSEGT